MKTIINGWDCTNLDQHVINLITKFNSNDELIAEIRKSEMDSKYNCHIFGGRQALIYMGVSGHLVAWIETKRENGTICLDPIIHI